MATSKDSISTASRQRIWAARIALIIGFFILALKWAAYALTSSTAVYSDAMESMVNVAAGGFLLFSMTLAARPADRNHPYGHGKVEYFSAGFEGALIVLAAILIFFRAGMNLVQPAELHSLDLGAWLVLLASIANGVVGIYLIRTGREVQSPALIADGKHLLTDVYTSGGVLFGLFAIYLTGWPMVDSAIAALIAIQILRDGWSLMRESIGGLMDEADEGVLKKMVDTLESLHEPYCIDVHNLRARRSAQHQNVEFHLSVPRFFDADQLHDINDHFEESILLALDQPGDVLIHFDPCRPRQCKQCEMHDCTLREAEYQSRTPLTLETVTRGDVVLDSGKPFSYLVH